MYTYKIFQKYWPHILVIVLCIFALLPLFMPGYFTMHDDEQIGRLYEMHTAISDGQIPPRWVPDLGFGFGYPLFNFYPPLVYYIGNLFYSIGLPLIISVKSVMALGFILAALFMYLWIRNRFGIWAGILSAVLYTYVPYHSVDIYVRGDLAEFFGFVWIPAVFYAYDLLFEKKKVQWCLLPGFLLACIILTHSLTAMIFLPFLGLYIALLLFEKRKDFNTIVLPVLLSGLIAVGLAAFFWLPSLAEKQFTLVDKILTGELANFSLHFVCLMQFWNSPWGYGGSVPGCNDGLSFQVGKVQLLLSLLSIISYFAVVVIKKKKHVTLFTPFLFTLGLLSLFMTTQYSNFIWNIVQPFSYIQFPWRFLLFTAVFTAGLGGCLVSIIQIYFSDPLAKILVIVITFATIFLTGKYFHPQTYLHITDDFYTKNNGIKWYVSSLSYEYVPRGVATHLSDVGTTKLNITKSDIPEKSYQVLQGSMNVSERMNLSNYKEYTIQSFGKGVFRINTFSFPGWHVFLDGNEIRYNDDNALKLITIPVNNGLHEVIVSFKNTPVRMIGNLISVLTLLFIGLLFFQSYSKKNRNMR